MNVTIQLGEPFWRLAGKRELAVWLPDSATAADALAALIQLHPALRAELEDGEVRPALFAGDDQAWPETRLAEGIKLYVVWPVSGG
jgi:sulfur carrier protein ThiS